jgi:hypothetical protein
MARITNRAWILAMAALLPMAACADRADEDDLPEAEDSRVPDYEVNLPDVDVDVDTDTATVRVPDIDVDVNDGDDANDGNDN